MKRSKRENIKARFDDIDKAGILCLLHQTFNVKFEVMESTQKRYIRFIGRKGKGLVIELLWTMGVKYPWKAKVDWYGSYFISTQEKTHIDALSYLLEELEEITRSLKRA